MRHFNTEAMKLGAMGVTIIAASGDDGAANGPDMCNVESGSDQKYTDWQVVTSVFIAVFSYFCFCFYLF
jgi:subtilase family serine protease